MCGDGCATVTSPGASTTGHARPLLLASTEMGCRNHFGRSPRKHASPDHRHPCYEAAMSLQEPLLTGHVHVLSNSTCECRNSSPKVTYHKARALACLQAVLCIACMAVFIMDWKHCAGNSHSNSSSSSYISSSSIQQLLGRRAGPTALTVKLSCRQGLPQSVVLTLAAIRVCLIVLNAAGLLLATALLHMMTLEPSASSTEDGQEVSCSIYKQTGVSNADDTMLLGHDADKLQVQPDSCVAADTTRICCCCCCSALSHPQVTELSLAVSLTVWLAVLASTCLVVVYWL